jgi:hypothetical protein
MRARAWVAVRRYGSGVVDVIIGLDCECWFVGEG